MYTIMIADDERIERNYLKSIISKYPSKYILVGEASNGDQAIKIALDKKPNVIIMDISMPLTDGLEASKTIKNKYENISIILNSAYSEFEFAQKAVNYDLDGYLLKPASEQEIIETISTSLHKRKLQGTMKLNNINISKELYSDYPYVLVDKLIDSILIGDFELIKFNTNNYLDYVRGQAVNLDQFRLHIINTVFSIMRVVKKVLTEEISMLFNYEEYLSKIGQAQYWYDILSYTEGFFKQLLIVFSNKHLSSATFTDLVERYIDDNFMEDITLELLSDIFHFSPAYISRKFHQAKGCTINDYLRQKRVNHAIYLLENSNIPVKEISVQSGFANVSHFNRVFKVVTGKVPSEFKNKGEKII